MFDSNVHERRRVGSWSVNGYITTSTTPNSMCSVFLQLQQQRQALSRASARLQPSPCEMKMTQDYLKQGQEHLQRGGPLSRLPPRPRRHVDKPLRSRTLPRLGPLRRHKRRLARAGALGGVLRQGGPGRQTAHGNTCWGSKTSEECYSEAAKATWQMVMDDLQAAPAAALPHERRDPCPGTLSTPHACKLAWAASEMRTSYQQRSGNRPPTVDTGLQGRSPEGGCPPAAAAAAAAAATRLLQKPGRRDALIQPR